MKKLTKYHKRLQVSIIKTALFVIILNILFIPQLTKFERDGDNYFQLVLNGEEIGYIGKETDTDRLLREARLWVGREAKEMIFMDAQLEKKGSEVFIGEIDSDDDIRNRMVEVLKKNVMHTIKHAYTVKIDEYTVNLSNSNEVRAVLQAALSQYEENNQYTADLVMDPTREVNVLTATVVNNATTVKEDTPAFPKSGIEEYLAKTEDNLQKADEDKKFGDFQYGLMDLKFGNKVEVIDTYLMDNQITPLEQAIEQVTTVKDINAVYEVQPGDTLSQIAEKTNISMDKIISLNDTIENELSMIRAGDEIIITQPEPPLSIERQEQMYYEENYDADIIYIDNDEWYTTEEVTRQEPSAGHRKVAAIVHFRNDKEISRELLKEEITMEAIPKIVEKGTKIPPTYIKPISGGRLSSSFGGRKAPTKGASTNHKGIDWATPKGTAVVASSGGTVTKAGWGSGYGYVVYIKHPDGKETRYGHLSKVLVSAGQSVKQGQKIALSGNTGRSTGPHLHFEIRINGAAVNPLKYLN